MVAGWDFFRTRLVDPWFLEYSRVPMPKLYSSTALIALAVALLACRGQTGDQAEAASSGPASSTSQNNPATAAQTLTVYSGRTEALVAPVIAEFRKTSGIEVKVKYAETAQLAAALIEEGKRSPADVFLAQDASTLGLLEARDLFTTLPESILSRVGKSAKSPGGLWVGITGRARVLAYNTNKLTPDKLPASSADLVKPQWKGRVGWAPENASFQSALSAMIQLEGKDAAGAWVNAMQKNQPRAYPKNTPAVLAVSRGEVDVALVNHYYLYRLRAEHGDDFPVANHYFRSGKADSLVNVAGVAIVATSKNKPAAEKFVSHLVGTSAQKYFATKNYEFPLVSGIELPIDLPDIATLNPPVVDLAKLTDLASAHQILRQAQALP